MRRLRILQIFSEYLEYGGEEFIAGKIEDALAERHEMFRYVGSTKELFSGGAPARAMIPWKTMYNQSVAQDLRKEQERNKYDLWLIHNVFPALSPSVFAVAKELDVPIVHYLHNYRMSCTNGYFLNHGEACEKCAQGNFWPALASACWRDSHMISGWMGLILQKMRRDDVFRQVRLWITPSENQKNIHIRMGLPASKIEVVPYYLEAEAQCPPPNPAGGVLFLGRLSPEKGVDVLLKAWAKVANQGRILRIAGTGPEKEKLQALAKRLCLTHVEWLNFVPRREQAKLWDSTAFSVIPSIWPEPYPLSFLEAWKNGRPFIGSKIGAMGEVLADGKGGLLAKVGSDADFAQQIEKYLQEPNKIAVAGAQGHAKLLLGNDKDKWIIRMEEVLAKSLAPTKEIGYPSLILDEIFYACTLFDSGYLAKGLALISSLKRQGKPFRLHIFTMDDFSANYIEGLKDPSLVVIRKENFEDEELLRIKPKRTRAEYYWTCGSSALLFCLEKLGLPMCTYLDADLCFYAPAQIIEAKMKNYSIGITPHAYAAAYDQNRIHGVYCVQYVTVRKDENGLKALHWWREKCLDWCYGRVEQGRFGDQKYLDDWPERFTGVKVLDGPGVGLAPWNSRNYQLKALQGGAYTVRDLSDGNEAPLVFYHFHELRFFTNHRIKLVAGGYEISNLVKETLYCPYIKNLLKLAKEVRQQNSQANPLAITKPPSLKTFLAKTYSLLNPHFHDHYLSLHALLKE